MAGKAVKGNMIIGQSGGPTAVINQSLIGAVTEAFKHKEISNVYGMLNGIDGILEDRIIDFGKEDKKQLLKVAQTPAAALGSCRHKPTEEECETIFEKLKKLDVRYFFYNGGNDTAETAHIINEIAKKRDYELRIFHIPKTIDNDLRETDHCPGYASAAKYVAMCFMGNNMDNIALPGIKIDVVMGRHAGWLTAASSLATTQGVDGPHLIYVPERPISLSDFTKQVLDTYEKYGRALVAVSEGLKTPDGKLMIESKLTEKDSHGNVQLSGSGMMGDFLVQAVKDAAGSKKLRVRSDTLGYAQRSFPGIYSEIDAKEAWMVGQNAVKYALSGNIDGSVILQRVSDGAKYKSKTALTELSKVAKHTKDLPVDFMNEEGNYVSSKFLDYAKPIVGPIPELGVLKKIRI